MPVPLRRSFDYLPPKSLSELAISQLQPGTRVLAPFGKRRLVGVLLEITEHSDIAKKQLKFAEDVLDQQAILNTQTLELCRWAASYYQHPIGDVISHALPVFLRKGQAFIQAEETRWRLTTEGKGLPAGALSRAAKQAQLLTLLQQQDSINKNRSSKQGYFTHYCKSVRKKRLNRKIQRSASKHCPPQRNTNPINTQ